MFCSTGFVVLSTGLLGLVGLVGARAGLRLLGSCWEHAACVGSQPPRGLRGVAGLLAGFGVRRFFYRVPGRGNSRVVSGGLRRRVLGAKPVAVVDFQLHSDWVPVIAFTGPFLCDVHHCQVEDFQQTIIGRKYAFCFCYFS